MKKYVFVWMLVAVVLSPSHILKSTLPVDDVEVGKRGAKAKEDLSDVVFNSIRMNQFEMLLNYIPNDNELKYLESHTARKDKYIYEGLDAEQLETNTKLNFQKVVQDGIQQEINWSTIEMTDSKVVEGKNKGTYKGVFSVQDGKATTMTISFDIIKVKNKWFLFQGIRVETEDRNIQAN